MSDVWTVLPRSEGAERALASLGAVGGEGQDMMHGLCFKRTGLASTYAIEVALASSFQEFLPWREVSEIRAKYDVSEVIQ